MTLNITLIILIVLSVLLLISAVIIVVLLVTRIKEKRNKAVPKNQNQFTEPLNLPQKGNEDYMKTFAVIGGESDFKPASPQNFQAGRNNFSAGKGDNLRSGFFDAPDKTEVFFDNPSFQTPDSGKNVTIQYFKNGVTQNFNLNGGNAVIGRNNTCDIIIDSDKYMSAEHATIFMKSGQVCISDLNSSNGTFVNGKKIEGVMVLGGSEQLKVASTEMRILIK